MLRKIVSITILLVLFSGCASIRAGRILKKSQESYDVFQKDFVKLSTVSLQREWMLRRAMADTALFLEIQADDQITSAAAKALVDKYLEIYKEDVTALEGQRSEHMKALINAEIGKELILAVQKYHQEGVTWEQVGEFVEGEVIPNLNTLIENKTSGGVK